MHQRVCLVNKDSNSCSQSSMMTSAAYRVVMYVVVVYAVMTYLWGCTPDEDHMDQSVYIKFCPKTSAASLDYSFLLCSL